MYCRVPVPLLSAKRVHSGTLRLQKKHKENTDTMSTTTTATDAAPHRLTPPDISIAAVVKLASPIFVANLSIMGAGTIDTIMAGRLGAEHLAAVALASATAVMIFISLVGILQGLSPISGHHYGARQYRKIGFELAQSMWLGAALLVLGLALMLQTDFWVAFGGAKGEVARMAKDYLFYSALGLPAAIISRPFIATNAAVNRPKMTMYVTLLALALKIPLNAMFMYGLCGIPAMGGAGAGASTCVNSWIALLAYWAIWRFDKFYEPMRSATFFLPNPASLRQHLKLGIPIGLSTFFEVSSFTLMAIFISRIGTIDVAAHQIVANITATLYQIPFSLGLAVSVLVAQCLGAGFPPQAEEVTFRTLKWGVCFAACCAVVLYFSREPLVALYTTDPAVQKLAVTLLIFGVVYHTTDACQSISAFAMRGYRVTFWPMVVYGVLLWAVGLGGGYWTGFSAETIGGPYGAVGFWAATGLGLTLAGIALAVMAVFVAKTRTREYREMISRHRS